MVISTSLFSTVLVGRLAKNCAKCILATTKIGPFSVAAKLAAPPATTKRLPSRFLGNLPKLRETIWWSMPIGLLAYVFNQSNGSAVDFMLKRTFI